MNKKVLTQWGGKTPPPVKNLMVYILCIPSALQRVSKKWTPHQKQVGLNLGRYGKTPPPFKRCRFNRHPFRQCKKMRKSLTSLQKAAYNKIMPAKSGIGIGVPNYTGDDTAIKAVFCCKFLPKDGVYFIYPTSKGEYIKYIPSDYGRDLWKYRKIRRLPVERYANSVNPYHPKLAFSVIGYSNLNTGN